MENRITVSDSIWQWVQNTISIPSLSASIQESFRKWASGDKQPTFNQLEDFSKKANIPLGYFFLQNPPDETCPVLEYRTLGSTTIHNLSRNLLDTVRHMEDIRDWMRDYLISESAQPVSYVASIDPEGDVGASVNMIRNTLSINETWYAQSKSIDDSFKRLRTAISNLGILVMQNGVVGSNNHRPLDISEFRAFCLIDTFAPLIFINAKDSRGGKIFSLLHEFVHIGVGEGSLINAETWQVISAIDPLETFCNRVVSEILVPEVQFKNKWQESSGDIELRIRSIANHFRCSQSVILRRCLDNKLISIDEYSKLQQKAKLLSQQVTDSSGGNYWATQLTRSDCRFLKALGSSVSEGKTPYTEAFRLTNTNLKTFDTMISKAKGDLV